ncbi:GtrA family protein [Rhodoblastus sp.]|uniref:GtrA family protein n=1 Tax=Rhodoblastus sp. TaxID=1962975 RepID=UPI0035B1FFD4
MIATRQTLFFGIAGTVGFLVDTAVLYLLKGWLGLYWGRAFSFLAAAATTWILNRTFTFGGRVSGHPPLKELALYIGLMTIGGSVNYLVYALLVTHLPLFARFPALAVAAGSLSGMTLNLLSSRFLVFRHPDMAPSGQELSDICVNNKQ